MNKYTIMNDEQQIENECVICFEIVNINKTHIKCCNCEKMFHKECMDKWRLKKKELCNCPSCTKPDLLLHKYLLNYDLCCIKIKRKKPLKKIDEYN